MPDRDEARSCEKTSKKILEEIAPESGQRATPTLAAARDWQTTVMEGLEPDNEYYIGRFRGEPELEYLQVRVGTNYGVDSEIMAAELGRFEAKLQALVAELDALLPVNQNPDDDQREAALDLCAWAHAEWVRIYPFANGNGRTARLWANFLATRYGLPPFVRLRPRPNAGYSSAGAKAMQGDWKPTAVVFHQLLTAYENDLGNTDEITDL